MMPFEEYADPILGELWFEDDDEAPKRKEKDEEQANDNPYEDHIPNSNYTNLTELSPLDHERQNNDNDFDLDPEDSELIDIKIQELGIEVLAFYKSIHNEKKEPYPGKWGIFVYDWALEKLGQEIFVRYGGKYDPFESRNFAWKKIHKHEMYHFFIDAWTLSKESILKRELYNDYLKEVYNVYRPGLEVVEESLANRFVFNSLKRGTPLYEVKDWVIDFMDRQPGAYANFRGDPVPKRAKLAAQILMGKKWKPQMTDESQAPWMKFNPKNPIHLPESCPNWLISNVTITGLPLLSYSLPKHSEISKYLENYCAGTLERTDHAYLKIDNGQKVKVPNKHSGEDCIRQFEFKNILHKSEISRPDYFYERERTKTWKPKFCPRKYPL